MGRLNELKVQALLKEGKPRVVAAGDGSGLALRITSTGAAWQLRYRHAGKAHWLTLGKYPDCSLKEAKTRATAERTKIDKGIDPVAERRRSELALKTAKTFRELWLDYEARALPDLKPDTQRIIRQFLKRDILPCIGSLRIEEITGAILVNMIEQVGKRADSAGRRAYDITSVIFSHGVAKQIAISNPCAGLKLRAILGKRKSIRPGVSLSEEQLRAVLANLAPIGPRNALAVKIILATCVRKVELRLAKPEHLDLETGAWTIPDENAKNSKSIVIPLAPVVVE
jgi:integrase